MRITRDNLIKIAHDAANQRVKISRRIICIYLTGSCLTDDPLSRMASRSSRARWCA